MKEKSLSEALLDDAQLSMVRLCRGDPRLLSQEAIDESIPMKI